MYNEADVGASQQNMSRDTEGLTDEENEIYNRIMRVVNGDNLRAIEVGIPVGLIQRCALLGSARILRKVLEM